MAEYYVEIEDAIKMIRFSKRVMCFVKIYDDDAIEIVKLEKQTLIQRLNSSVGKRVQIRLDEKHVAYIGEAVALVDL